MDEKSPGEKKSPDEKLPDEKSPDEKPPAEKPLPKSPDEESTESAKGGRQEVEGRSIFTKVVFIMTGEHGGLDGFEMKEEEKRRKIKMEMP